MPISKWLCTKNSKSTVVKIVHPGGHRELHDRPILASEIMRRNPKCLVTYPNVFQQPSAVVSPDTMLLLGQKFYVVPATTVRKLQRHHRRQTPSPLHNTNPEFGSSQKHNMVEEKKDSDGEEGCFSRHKCFKIFNGIVSG